MFKLRPYQKKAVDDIRDHFKDGKKKCILQAPTGSGKTVIFSTLSKLVADKGNKILILTDRVELLIQADGSIRRVGLKSYFIQAGIKLVSNAFSCYIAMSQTFRRRIDNKYWQDFLKTIDLIIIDECHKQEFNYLFGSGLVDNKFIIGFTATPRRSGSMRQLAIDYDTIIETVSVKQLIEQGYLVNDDYYGVEGVDMEGVEIDYMKGDYKENQMFQRFNSTQLYSGLIKNYKEICEGTKTLVFCVNIQHCIKTVIEMQKEGLTAKFITSSVTMPKKPDSTSNKGKIVQYEERMKIYNLYQKYFPIYSGNRKTIFKDFEEGKFDILVNAGIATTGYDCPSIETIILNRATTSTTLLLQMIGRGSRIFENKTHFNLLDFGSNCQRLGYYSEDRWWSLWHEKVEGTGIPPVKECGFTLQGKPIKKGGCRRLILASYKICPFCGFKYPTKKEKEIELRNLLYSDGSTEKVKRVKDMTYDELYRYWKKKGHKSAWLWRQLWFKGGQYAVEQFGKRYNWSYVTIQKAINFCKKI